MRLRASAEQNDQVGFQPQAVTSLDQNFPLCRLLGMRLTGLEFWFLKALCGLKNPAQFSLVAESCWTLHPMDCKTPGFPVHHQLLELAQTHVHPVGDAIEPSHPLLSPSAAFNLSQVFSTCRLLPSGGQRIGTSASASVLPMNIQD